MITCEQQNLRSLTAGIIGNELFICLLLTRALLFVLNTIAKKDEWG